MEHSPLTDSELNRINKALISKDHKRCFAIARYTGEPFGRIIKLKTGDVYFDKFTPLKYIKCLAPTNELREILVTPILQRALIRYRPQAFDPDLWLFPSSIREGEHVTASNVGKWFRAALLASELDGRDISPSDVRRAFIYKLHDLGFSDQDVKEVVGLKTLHRYRKDFGSQPVNVWKVVERIFEQD